MTPRIVGHRGAALVAPENTLASFRRGIADGADLLECDVHLSADGHLVVIHDATVDRTAAQDSPRRSGAVADLTRAELDEVRLGPAAGMRTHADGEGVPALEDVLDLTTAARVPLLVEVKAPAAAEPLARLLLARGLGSGTEGAPSAPAERDPAGPRTAGGHTAGARTAGAAGGVDDDPVVVISFDREALEAVHRIAPDIPIGLVTRTPTDDDWEFARSLGASRFAVHIAELREHDVRRAHEAGLQLNTWTLNDPGPVSRAVELDVDTFTTDDPAWARTMMEAALRR